MIQRWRIKQGWKMENHRIEMDDFPSVEKYVNPRV